ncbi:actin nucleation-promoting factor WASL-like [Saccopteryx bilineata]|uniref:actin nucleation-promoting factor WASL-like n=1 Tax=Saccopteryx bilineata TaxID=59482 RepID=UPI00338DBF9E
MSPQTYLTILPPPQSPDIPATSRVPVLSRSRKTRVLGSLRSGKEPFPAHTWRIWPAPPPPPSSARARPPFPPSPLRSAQLAPFLPSAFRLHTAPFPHNSRPSYPKAPVSPPPLRGRGPPRSLPPSRIPLPRSPLPAPRLAILLLKPPAPARPQLPSFSCPRTLAAIPSSVVAPRGLPHPPTRGLTCNGGRRARRRAANGRQPNLPPPSPPPRALPAHFRPRAASTSGAEHASARTWGRAERSDRPSRVS